MGNKALVIGASGFLGSHVTRQLVASGRPVRILVRPTSRTDHLDELPVERVLGDVLDPASLREAMAGCSAVYHCAVDTRAWQIGRDTSELQSRGHLVCRLLLEKKKNKHTSKPTSLITAR